MIRSALLCSVWSLSLVSAPAALTLTIDTSNTTLTWSGTVDSTAIPTAAFDTPTIIISTTFTANPTGPTPYVQMGAMAVDMTYASTIVTGAVNLGPQRLYVDSGNNLLSLIVATMVDIDGGGSTTLTLAGDGVAYDYSAPGLSAAQLSTLASMSGAELKFYRTDNPGIDFGTAGNVVVIPEPGVLVLVGTGLLVLIAGRRRWN